MKIKDEDIKKMYKALYHAKEWASWDEVEQGIGEAIDIVECYINHPTD